MGESRYGSVQILVRVLAGASPVTRHHPVLTTALERLRSAHAPLEIERLDRMIWRLWSSAGSRDAVRAFDRALLALSTAEFGDALRALEDAVAAAPTFAEAWNRRATVFYLLGENAKAIADIERVLVLEPRHYGALSGLGQLLLQEGEAGGALAAFESALGVNPHLIRVREARDRIRSTLPMPALRRPLLH